MEKFYKRLLESLNISGRDLAVFVLALLLAFSIWLIHNLTLKYNDYLTAPVIAQCNLDGHSNLSINQSEIVARCRATGYRVLKLKMHRKPVTVTFDPSVMRHKEDDMYYVTASDLTEYTHLIYGEGATLEYFVSDTVLFRFPEMANKKVPVYPVYSITFADQYMSDGQLKVVPDSVTIYGENSRLSTIDKVFTNHIQFSSLTSDIQGVAKIEGVRNVRMSAEEVHYMLDVTRYVEISKTLPVKVVNLPAGKGLQIFPSTATVSAKFSFPLTDNGHENMELMVDYNDYAESLSGKCPVKLVSEPKGLIYYEVSPVAVNAVLEDR